MHSVRRLGQLTSLVLAIVLLLAGVASAGSITTPSTTPFTAPADQAGAPVGFTVVVSGMTPGTQVYLEQCDGVSGALQTWDPTVDCDLGSSPAPATANPSGVATFDVTDANHRFTPFDGMSPQGLFNCLAPTQTSPNNGLTDFTNCQLRASTNLTTRTADQAFLTLTLPKPIASTNVGASYTSSEYQIVSYWANHFGMNVDQFQYQMVWAWKFIYGISGTSPSPITPPSPGSIPVTTAWPTTEIPALQALATGWGNTQGNTERIAADAGAFLLSLAG